MKLILKDNNDDEVLIEFHLNESGLNDAGQDYNFKFYPNENIRIKIDKINEELND